MSQEIKARIDFIGEMFYARAVQGAKDLCNRRGWGADSVKLIRRGDSILIVDRGDDVHKQDQQAGDTPLHKGGDTGIEKT